MQDVTNHSVAREVVTFFTLPPGEYVVMPQVIIMMMMIGIMVMIMMP